MLICEAGIILILWLSIGGSTKAMQEAPQNVVKRSNLKSFLKRKVRKLAIIMTHITSPALSNYAGQNY